MLIDLAAHDEPQARQTDVLIIGAGIAGLILAARLRKSTIPVMILESGGREQSEETHPLNRTIQLGDAYSGATRGRFRCLGGTSTRWGGALIPFNEHDLAARPYLGLSGFPIAPEAVRRHLGEVEALFDLDTGSYDEAFVDAIGASEYIPIGDKDFIARFAKWPAFRKRNVAKIFESLIEQDKNLEVWLNSTATKFNVDCASGRIKSVVGSCEGNRSITVSAKIVVICAGAIETTRLLLLIDRQYNRRIFTDCKALGRFFNDHISLPVAEVMAKRIDKLNRLAGFRFVGSTMRSLRFELSNAVQERECVGSAFAHISFSTKKKTGFDALRELLRAQQRRGKIDSRLLVEALLDLPYFARMGFWRIFYKQLLWPVPAKYEVHVVAEQMPRIENCITLSSEQDCFGLPIAAIQWRAAERDFDTFGVFRRYFDSFWKRQRLDVIGELKWTYDLAGCRPDPVSNADVFHPGGSTRMGTNRQAAVVDSDLRSFEIANLWVASTSVFPSGGGENPTLMLTLLALRLADHLSNNQKTWN